MGHPRRALCQQARGDVWRGPRLAQDRRAAATTRPSKAAMLAIKYSLNIKDEILLMSKEDIMEENPNISLDDVDAWVLTFAYPLASHVLAGGVGPPWPVVEFEYDPFARRTHGSLMSPAVPPQPTLPAAATAGISPTGGKPAKKPMQQSFISSRGDPGYHLRRRHGQDPLGRSDESPLRQQCGPNARRSARRAPAVASLPRNGRGRDPQLAHGATTKGRR